MHGNTHIRSFSWRRCLSGIETILIEVSLLSIGITLHKCYILLSIALNLLLHENTILRLGVLRWSCTYLGLLATKRPLHSRLLAIANKCHTGEQFLMVILYFELF